MRKKKGVTMVELVIVIAVIAILASAFSSVMVPVMNFFFYFPQSARVNAAGADVLQIILEGDEKAKGLRFAGLPCAPSPWVTATAYVVGDAVFQNNIVYYCIVNHNSGVFATDLTNLDWTTSPVTVATATALTYRYGLSDVCGTTNSYSVALAYDSGNHIVTRSINGGAAVEIPYYATNASGIKIDPPASTNFFRYYDNQAAPAEMTGGGIVIENIYRVDITVNATSGSGQVKHGAGQITLKAGTNIKRYKT